jgi:hypothetical protein
MLVSVYQPFAQLPVLPLTTWVIVDALAIVGE